MFEAFVRNGILVTVAALIICVLGVLAAVRVPVQMIPDLEVRTVSIQTSWPGATPQDVEKEILIEQEEYLRTLPNMQRLESTASSGSAVIELDFPFGVDITQTLIEVNNALNQVPSYPENVDEPRVFASSFSANSFMFFGISPLPGNPRNIDIVMMRDFVVDNVRTRLSGVPGVSQVLISGGAERQIRILLDPVRLADRQLTIVDVRNAIQRPQSRRVRRRYREREAPLLAQDRRSIRFRRIPGEPDRRSPRRLADSPRGCCRRRTRSRRDTKLRLLQRQPYPLHAR